MKARLLKLITLTTLASTCLIAQSCKKDLPAEQTASTKTTAMTVSAPAPNDGPTVLGRRYNNPYTLANMRAAKLKLDAQGKFSGNPFNVRVTHLYVKFTPKTAEELDELIADSTLNLYECPMDYEKLVAGNWYREQGLADDVPTPQYAAVKEGFKFSPDISYEILERLYIPEEDPLLIGTYFNEDLDYLSSLLNEAYELAEVPTGWENHVLWPNDPGSGSSGGGGVPPPTGRILVNDTRLGQDIPMEGVKVTANRWFTTYKGYTNAQGDYRLSGGFDRPADYTIVFERSGFTIAKNRLQRAKINRSNIPDNHWSHTIDDGLDRMHGHMFRAGYRYFYKDNGGLRRPFLNNGWQVVVVSQNNSGHYWGSGVNAVLVPYLFITRFSTGSTEYGSDEIFSTTVHELAHTTHILTMNGGPIQSSQVNGIIRESWAVAVEWLLTGIEYRQQGIATYGDRTYNPTPAPQYPNHLAYQYWNSNISENYTSLFINLIDDFNEMGVNFPTQGNGTVNDQVRNYNLVTIENLMLKHIYGLSTLGAQLKANKPAGVTDAQIDLILSFY